MADKVDIFGGVPVLATKPSGGEGPHQVGLAAAMALIVGSIIGGGHLHPAGLPGGLCDVNARRHGRRRCFPTWAGIILGWILTWAVVEPGMLQWLLDTKSLTGRQWVVVIALSLLAPAVVAVDKAIQLSRQRQTRRAGDPIEAELQVPGRV